VLVPPQARLKTQQTPNEEAQVPDAVPPLLVHSDAVKQVPLYPVEAPHAMLGKVTTLNTLSAFLVRISPLDVVLFEASWPPTRAVQ